MPVSNQELSDLWLRFSVAMGMETGAPEPDGSYRVRFADGVVFDVRSWRGEAVFISDIADLGDEGAGADDIVKRLMYVSLAKAAEWDEALYIEQDAVRLWRRFTDARDAGFSIEGIETFLNRVDFWRRQVGSVEAQARRYGGSGSFVAFDQFG